MFLKFTQIRLSQLFYLPFFFFVCLFDLICCSMSNMSVDWRFVIAFVVLLVIINLLV